jgi:hypothetical protein
LKVAVKGHLVNRLQGALWQEMMHLVWAGAATAEQVDAAVRYAIGPRKGRLPVFISRVAMACGAFSKAWARPCRAGGEISAG